LTGNRIKHNDFGATRPQEEDSAAELLKIVYYLLKIII
jgi:hypothetical protein